VAGPTSAARWAPTISSAIERVRFKQVDDDFWNAAEIGPAWERTKRVWQLIVKFLERYGILTNGLMPSDAVFVPLSALFDKFKDIDRAKVTHWMMQALRYGRYSGSSASSLDEDLREIEAATTGEEALAAMLGRIRAIEPVSKDEFLRDYGDTRFGRLLLYILMFDKAAIDWDTNGDRIAFQGADLVRGFEPQFHHIFPRNFLEGRAKPEQIEALANIAIIGATTNIRISNKDPLDYFARYRIDATKRTQQFIEGDVAAMTPANFPTWLDERAKRLAAVANEFLTKLSGKA
jgi:hypothetical protein